MNANLSLLGLNILLLIVIWKFMVRPTVLDRCRDSIFDLRESLRDYFAHQNRLDSEGYLHVRGILNNYLRFTEDYNLISIVALSHIMKANSEVLEKVQEQNESKLKSLSPDDLAFVSQIRDKASKSILAWLFNSSLLASSLLLTYIVLTLVKQGLQNLGAPCLRVLEMVKNSSVRFQSKFIDAQKVESLPSLYLHV